MLNDAGGYGTGDEGEREAPTDSDQVFQKLQKQCKQDYNSKGQTRCRREAREDFDFEAGEPAPCTAAARAVPQFRSQFEWVMAERINGTDKR